MAKLAFPPTEEQQAFRDAFASGLTIRGMALAGTGKTTTLQFLAEDHPEWDMTYLSFNRAIADHAELIFPRNVLAKTMHSFAMRQVGKNYRHRLEAPRVEVWQVADILGLPRFFEHGDLSLGSKNLARLVMDALKRFYHSDLDEPAPRNIPKVPALTSEAARRALEDLLMPFLREAWEDVQSLNGRLRFSHDAYLKIWSLDDPKIPGRVILADEAQDYNPVFKRILLNQDAMILPIGDTYQQIYDWRGSVNALNMFEVDVELSLQQSFRFGPRVADLMNVILSSLGADLRLIGLESRDSQLARLVDPDCVLTRTNAEAIARLMAAQVAGTRAGLVGGTTAVEALAKAALDLTEGRKTTHPELGAFNNWAQVEAYVQEDPDAVEIKVLVKLVNRHGPEALLEAVQRAVPEHRAELGISTTHKAKGREWDRVALAGDFNPYDEDADTWSDAELRLAYVGGTRAKHFLDPTQWSWMHQLLAEDGQVWPAIVAAEDVPSRPVPEAPEVPEAQLVPDPTDATMLMFCRTPYSAELVAAQQKLSRSRFRGEHAGQTKVRLVLATPQAIQVAERFGLTISDAARTRVEELFAG